MTHTIYAVVDANGEFKRRGRLDTGEYPTQREAKAFLASLPNPEDYTVQSFAEDLDTEAINAANQPQPQKQVER